MSLRVQGRPSRRQQRGASGRSNKGRRCSSMGVVTGSADRTVRLWMLLPEPDPYDLPQPPLTLLTPTRTLRGHSESVTCLELLRGPGATMAATAAKDRTVRLWGLAPLRGHGAPVSCLAAVCDPGR